MLIIHEKSTKRKWNYGVEQRIRLLDISVQEIVQANSNNSESNKPLQKVNQMQDLTLIQIFFYLHGKHQIVV